MGSSPVVWVFSRMKPWVGRYDGVDYEVPQNEWRPYPREVAEHLFGYGLVDKSSVVNRWGWTGPMEKIFSAFQFSEVDPKTQKRDE